MPKNPLLLKVLGDLTENCPSDDLNTVAFQIAKTFKVEGADLTDYLDELAPLAELFPDNDFEDFILEIQKRIDMVKYTVRYERAETLAMEDPKEFDGFPRSLYKSSRAANIIYRLAQIHKQEGNDMFFISTTRLAKSARIPKRENVYPIINKLIAKNYLKIEVEEFEPGEIARLYSWQKPLD